MRCRCRRSPARSKCWPPTVSRRWSIAREGYTPTPAISHAILTYNRGRKSGLADGIVITPSHNPPPDGGFKYNPPNGGPADTDGHQLDSEHRQRFSQEQARRREARSVRARAQRASTLAQARLHCGVCRRPGQRRRHGEDSQRGRAARDRSARRRGRALLAGGDRQIQHQGDGGQRRRRSDISLHDRRLGRQDQDGLLVAVRDGAAARDARSLRRRVRQRHRRRPPWNRHALERPDESESLSRRRDLVPVSQSHRDGAETPPSARRW